MSFVAFRIGTSTPYASRVRATACSCRNVTTGLPSAIDSIANSPYQPALSWSTTMSTSWKSANASAWCRSSTMRSSTSRPLAGGDHVVGALALP